MLRDVDLKPESACSFRSFMCVMTVWCRMGNMWMHETDDIEVIRNRAGNGCCGVLAAHLHIELNGNLTEENLLSRSVISGLTAIVLCPQKFLSLFCHMYNTHTHSHTLISSCIPIQHKQRAQWNQCTRRHKHPLIQNTRIQTRRYIRNHPPAHAHTLRARDGLWMTAIQICCSLWSTLSRKHHDQAGFNRHNRAHTHTHTPCQKP